MRKTKKKADGDAEWIDHTSKSSTGESLGKLNTDVDDEIRQLESAVKVGMDRLTLKQRRFVEAWSTGDYSRKDAAMKAGHDRPDQ